ncbi:MAG: hypothetical protein ACD_36C00081G0003 [uncultured bacterium]|uniref:ParB/Sulfiredoxin domain-containing protein n=1 Tax=Candidatus Gottesmanbacteria bacterium RIFCSPLOWO2_01_FULL_43_11b TaxID=1798392 RepID=A0A1F6AHN2_9BACT|nr:MAG: hypothetical protein ACD_36C00081G0003 [uncultured bacterium]OGG23972.1 MAG: hypothetical protein A3A79_02105 [Candidatus Gottesmanbacteria bacterium RIFCSPLOWO2_01_FULL_43_11b]
MEPDLRLVPLNAIERQEEGDKERIERLVKGMTSTGVIHDPPIVAAGLNGKKLIQLDGVTRLSSLPRLGCSHVVVQYVDYNDSSQVLIKSWVHVSKVNPTEFVRRIKSMKGVKTENFQLGLGLTLTGHPLAAVTIIFRNGKGLSVIGSSNLIAKVRLMKRVVDLYATLIARDREVSIEGMTELKQFFQKHPEKNVALFFPSFASHEIYALMKKSITLPQGVTRHIVNGRVLNIDYPIKMLHKDTPNTEKRKYFENFLKNLQLRFYEESTFVVE